MYIYTPQQDNNKRLTGSIITEIGLLTSLRVLNLGYDNFIGELPSELGQLSSFISSINVGGNKLLTGSLPLSLLSLKTSLGKLDYSIDFCLFVPLTKYYVTHVLSD